MRGQPHEAVRGCRAKGTALAKVLGWDKCGLFEGLQEAQCMWSTMSTGERGSR